MSEVNELALLGARAMRIFMFEKSHRLWQGVEMRRLTRREINGYGLRYEHWERTLFDWHWDECDMPVRYFYSPQSMDAWARRTGMHNVFPRQKQMPASDDLHDQSTEYGAIQQSAIVFDFTQYRARG